MGFFLQNFLDAKKKQMVFSETEKSEWVFLKPKKAKEKEKTKTKAKTKTKNKNKDEEKREGEGEEKEKRSPFPIPNQSAKSCDLCVAFCGSRGASVRQRRACRPLQNPLKWLLPLFRHPSQDEKPRLGGSTLMA